MLFNSYIFILLFLPLCVIGWYLLNRTKSECLPKAFLFGMSLWFYGYFNYKYLYIIIISIIANFLLFKLLKSNAHTVLRKSAFAAGMVLNIGLLFYYKYLGFFTENINSIFGTDFVVTKLLLPLGISFFTFQQVSFIIDSYKKTVPDYSFIDYALFVSFFPQLIAGPIVLHDEVIPQFADKANKSVNYENLSKGLYAFSFGMAKKVLVADTFGNIANIGFGAIPDLDSTNAVLAMLAYTLQIYFDFSGYCDMATGIALMFNIKLPINFNSPYRALDMEDFWKRWHITLTRFLTQNVYIPLGGNRKGNFRTYLNQLIVFTVSGIWHGANWTFILWGVLNGISVVLAKLLKKPLNILKQKHKFVPWLFTFVFINVMWIYFRADSISLANQMIKTVFSFDFGAVNPEYLSAVMTAEFQAVSWLLGKFSQSISELYGYILFAAFFIFAAFASVKLKNTNERLLSFKPNTKRLIVSALLLVWSVISLSGVSTFLYFNF